MNNPFNPLEFNPLAMQKAMDAIKKENDKALQHRFSGLIKGNFLILIKDRVMSKIANELPNLYDLRLTAENMVSNGNEAVEYDICRHIVGIHRSNLIYETIDKRKELEKSEVYQQELIEKVIAQIKLRPYGSAYFRLHPIMQGESFIFFPVPYYSFVLCIKILEILHTDMARKELPCYSTFSSIANKGLAALSLLEDNFLDNAYPICRGVIELYIKLLVLLNKPECLDQYIKFTEFELDKSCISQTYSSEFNALYNSRTHQGSRDKIDYLHYGWVDTIPDYHSVVRAKPYSINGLIEYVRYLYADESQTFFDNLEFLFKMCHGYTHGSVAHSKYPLLHYFEIAMMLYGTIRHTYSMICEILDKDTAINGINVLSELDEAYRKLETQHSKRTTENFEYYYKCQFKI